MFNFGPPLWSPVTHVCNTGPAWAASTLPASGNWVIGGFGPDGQAFAMGTDTSTALFPKIAAYSTDYGKTWSAATAPVWPNHGGGVASVTIHSSAFDGRGNAVAGTTNTNVDGAVTYDSGQSWTASVLSPAFSDKYCWFNGSNRFFAASTGQTAVQATANGSGWAQIGTLPTTPSGGSVVGACNGNGIHIIAGNNQSTYRSVNDGVTWTAGGNLPGTYVAADIAYGFGSWVIVDNSNILQSNTHLIVSTDDGVTWSAVTVPAPAASSVGWTSITPGQGLIVVCSTSNGAGQNSIIFTNDGVNWQSSPNQLPLITGGGQCFWVLYSDGLGHFIGIPTTPGVNQIAAYGTC